LPLIQAFNRICRGYVAQAHRIQAYFAPEKGFVGGFLY